MQVNKTTREALEKSYRLMYEQLENKWQYFESSEVKDEKDKRRLDKMGVKSEYDMAKQKKVESSRPGIFVAKQLNLTLQQYADILGLPV